MNAKTKKLVAGIALVVFVSISCYVFCPLSIRIAFHQLSGEPVYEYQYSESGKATILLNYEDKTVSFIDTNIVGPLGIIGVRGVTVYNLQTEKIQKVSGFNNTDNQYGYLTNHEDTKVLVSIQIPKMEDGVPDLHLFQYGISVDPELDDLLYWEKLYQEDWEKYVIFARNVTSW